MIMREIAEYIKKEGPVTFEQLAKQFPYKDLTYYRLSELIADGKILKVQSGDIFLYKVNNRKDNNDGK